MTTRDEIIALALDHGANLAFDHAEQLETFFHAAQKQAYERAAGIADANCEDEPYGHAKFRCVNIATEIRALIVGEVKE